MQAANLIPALALGEPDALLLEEPQAVSAAAPQTAAASANRGSRVRRTYPQL
jgi:hypothetical protein